MFPYSCSLTKQEKRLYDDFNFCSVTRNKKRDRRDLYTTNAHIRYHFKIVFSHSTFLPSKMPELIVCSDDPEESKTIIIFPVFFHTHSHTRTASFLKLRPFCYQTTRLLLLYSLSRTLNYAFLDKNL